ncbi:hypothetical protein HY091_00295 [Candidatus Kaiserbacteria bacterium]|nr:hypothetical protein [Candidatus Kaiserbacteria bacterium]
MSEKKSSGEQEPSQEAVAAYLENAEKELFTNELEILADPRFEHGFDGKEPQWKGLKDRVVMQGIVALKLAKLLKLPKEDTKILASAALLNMSMRCVQYKRPETKDSTKITTTQREALDDEGSAVLREKGVDKAVIKVAEASNTRFSRKAGGGWINPKGTEGKKIYRLQKILLYVHDTVNPIPVGETTTESGQKITIWGIEFGDWRERLTDSAVKSYQTINAESFPVKGKKERQGYFALEMKVVAEAENDIRKALKKNKVQLGKAPLWQFLEGEVHADIRGGRLPEIS